MSSPLPGLFNLFTEEDQQNIKIVQDLPIPIDAVSEYLSPLKTTYTNLVSERTLKKGDKCYVCVRCNKPVKDAKKLIIEPHSAAPYGTDCYDRIAERVSSLKRSNPFNVLSQLSHHELQTFECSQCKREFQSTGEHVAQCGGEPRCCFCCPDTNTKDRHLHCTREQFHLERINSKKTRRIRS